MAKKKKRSRRSGGGTETQQKRQERLQARREAKEQALRAQARRERRERLVRIAVIATLLTALIWFVFLRTSTPEAIAGHDVVSFSTDNGGQQTHQEPYDYDEEQTGINPPVSGRHSPSAAECGIHNEKIPDENFVHTLEHGAVAVLYRPNLDLAEIKEIEGLVSDHDDKTLSAPNPDLETPVVVASWAHKMPLDSVDTQAINEYIDTFREKPPAPEAKQDCPNSADEAFEPPEPDEPDDGGGNGGGGNGGNGGGGG